MRQRLTLSGLLEATASAVAAISLVTAVGVSHWAIDLFTHFRVQYLVLGLLFLPLVLWMRAWLTAALLVVASIVSSVLILQWYAPPDPTTPGATELKVVHANVRSSNDQYDRLIDFVREEDPDIVFLQEVNASWSIAAHALRSDWHHGHVVTQEGNYGIAVFSKIPFKDVGHVYYEPMDLPSIVGVIDVDGALLNVVSTHQMIPTRADLHRARNDHLSEIAALVSELAGPVLLAGDLNTSLWDPALTRFSADSGLINGRRGKGILPTWPNFFPLATIPIDHVLVTPGVQVVSLTTGPDIGSDHLPLVATIRW